MISFRYHLVTIVVIFLALALGLLAGTGFLEPRLVDQLKKQSALQRTTIGDLRGRVTQLDGQVGELQGFADQVFPYLAQGRLPLSKVVVVAQRDVDGAVLGETRTALAAAGADVVAELSVQPKLASTDEADRQQLAATLGLPTSPPPADLLAQAARSLGGRLATVPPLGPSDTDVLSQLLNQGFLVSKGLDNAREIGGRGQVVVVLSGGMSDSFLAPEGFLVPLVEELVHDGVRVAAGEPTTTAYRFVEILRSDAAVGNGTDLVTVDDLEQSMGGLALVLGLRGLITSDQGGNYGVKGGADPIPPLT